MNAIAEWVERIQTMTIPAEVKRLLTEARQTLSDIQYSELLVQLVRGSRPKIIAAGSYGKLYLIRIDYQTLSGDHYLGASTWNTEVLAPNAVTALALKPLRLELTNQPEIVKVWEMSALASLADDELRQKFKDS
jgi:hypothetical protein